MQSLTVVEPDDVIHDVFSGFSLIGLSALPDAFHLEAILQVFRCRLNESINLKAGNNNNVLEGIKKGQLKRRMFTLDLKAEVVRHKKAESLSFTECARKFDVWPKLIQQREKQYEAGQLAELASVPVSPLRAHVSAYVPTSSKSLQITMAATMRRVCIRCYVHSTVTRAA